MLLVACLGLWAVLIWISLRCIYYFSWCWLRSYASTVLHINSSYLFSLYFWYEVIHKACMLYYPLEEHTSWCPGQTIFLLYWRRRCSQLTNLWWDTLSNFNKLDTELTAWTNLCSVIFGKTPCLRKVCENWRRCSRRNLRSRNLRWVLLFKFIKNVNWVLDVKVRCQFLGRKIGKETGHFDLGGDWMCNGQELELSGM